MIFLKKKKNITVNNIHNSLLLFMVEKLCSIGYINEKRRKKCSTHCLETFAANIDVLIWKNLCLIKRKYLE